MDFSSDLTIDEYGLDLGCADLEVGEIVSLESEFFVGVVSESGERGFQQFATRRTA